MNTNNTSHSAGIESSLGSAITGSPSVDYSNMDSSVQHFGLQEAEQQQHNGSAKPSGIKSGSGLRDELSNIKSDLDTLLSRVTSLSQKELNSARDSIMTKFSSVQESAKGMASSAQESAKGMTSSAKDMTSSIQDSAKGLASNASRMASDTKLQLEQGVDATTEYVREKPLQSIAIATGVGFLLASLFRRH
jgi:ElaB/YqjD/DUF883 family membrane-anchored ribosome-binding protein